MCVWVALKNKKEKMKCQSDTTDCRSESVGTTTKSRVPLSKKSRHLRNLVGLILRWNETQRIYLPPGH